MPTVHVVDDNELFRNAVGNLLNACGYQVILYESAWQFLEILPTADLACILLDVEMPGLNGPQLQDRLAQLECRVPIVFLTGYGDIPTTVQTMKAGAEDFLTKPVEKERLLMAITGALGRCEEIRQSDTRIADLRALYRRLTPRENDVFALLVRGKPHKQIAYELGTSERTVKMHRHNVMEKCRVQSPAQLAVIAERLGLLSTS